ncbi:PREDICTED: uncharacterized protein LOC107192499 [Dufourea novaeangliae]|uniref:uncharacterized protein LOC107192499 n=1 Tax=Dufourea novaeangliae TaxID=178035 RepID=UPI00076760B0|nr:PREDICTED: uncharacterized protein LOC107192499 [Dufourea novaeangliae]
MNDKERLNSDLQGMLDEFTRVRDSHVGLKAYCDAQEVTLQTEKERSERMKEILENLSKAYMLLEKRYKITVDELSAEKEGLCKTIESLKDQCDHLRLIATDRNGDDDQVSRLQDEVEVLKTQLVLQEEKFNEDKAHLKRQHSDEVQRYKVLLQAMKLDTASVSGGGTKKRGRPKGATKNQSNPSFFRWPELHIERVSSAPMDAEDKPNDGNEKNKKRKLFHEDTDGTFNIV